MKNTWQNIRVAPDETHHIVAGSPMYTARFGRVLKFHAPGLAPVMDDTGAYHIGQTGVPAYDQRYVGTFGFYEGFAAVEDASGWFHIRPDGTEMYGARYSWCGNFQEGRCPVRAKDGLYLHLADHGQPAYEARHGYVGDYRDGIAVIQNPAGLHTHIDREGRPIHGERFEDLDVFHKGFARAKDRLGWCHVGSNGQELYARRFTNVEPFYNGQARVETLGGDLEIIDESGQTIQVLRPGTQSPLHRLSGQMVGFWQTQTIRTASELGVFGVLPASSEIIAEQIGLAANMTARLLRALWDAGHVQPDSKGNWEATETGSLLAPGSSSGMSSAAIMWGGAHYQAWGTLTSLLRKGESAAREDFFASLHGDDLQTFHDALSGYASHDYADIPTSVNWMRHKCVVDAGGAHGALLFHLLRKRPHLNGVLLDRPEVVREAVVPEMIRERCQVSEADLFATWPAQGDAIVMSRVLHDWPDDKALTLLQKARKSLSSNGRIYIVEMVLPGDTPHGGLLDLNLFVMTGGRERSLIDWRHLLSQAGLMLCDIHPLNNVASVLEVAEK